MTSTSQFHIPLKVQNGASPSIAVYGDKTYSHKIKRNRFKWENFLPIPGECIPFQHKLLCSTILNIEQEWQMWGRPESSELEAPELAMSACIATLNLAASAQQFSAIWWVTLRHVSYWVRHTHVGGGESLINILYDHVKPGIHIKRVYAGYVSGIRETSWRISCPSMSIFIHNWELMNVFYTMTRRALNSKFNVCMCVCVCVCV